MAVKISGLLTPNSGNYVAEAKNIAITLGEETKTLQAEIEDLIDSIPTTEQTGADIKYDSSADSETIKKKIDDINTALSSLGTSADKISYTKSGETEATTVKAILDELLIAVKTGSIENAAVLPINLTEDLTDGTLGKYLKDRETITADDITYDNGTILQTLTEVLDNINDSVESCKTNANNTQEAYNNTVLQVALAESKVNLINNAVSTMNEINNKYSNINEIANDLQASLNLSSTVQVLTEEAYNNLTTDLKNNGSIYLLYNTNSDGDYYCVIGVSTDSTMGTVTGSNNNAYKGSTVTLIAVPNSGYEVYQWKNNINNNIDTGGTSKTINASQNIVYQVLFKPIPTTIISSVKELSGLTMFHDTLIGVSDDTEGEGGIYTIGSDGTTTKIITINTDNEGVTCDGNGNLYICTEGTTETIDSILTTTSWSQYSGTIAGNCDIIKIPYSNGSYGTPEIYGTVLEITYNSNKGLEGITYYDNLGANGEPRFLIGNQKKPITLVLWSKTNGIEASLSNFVSVGEKTDDEWSITTNANLEFTTEIGDLCYDGTYLWILDSKTAKVYKCSITISGTSINLSVLKTYDFSTNIDMSETFNDGDGENPEALFVTSDYIYVGCDYNSKIYKFTK